MKVLVVGSDRSVLFAVRRGLKDSPCRAVTASDARRIRQVLHSFRPDVVILDDRMLDAWDACAPTGRGRWAMIGMLADASPGFGKAVAVLRSRGADDILRRPFSPDECGLRVQAAYRLRSALLRVERLRRQHRITRVHLEECSDRLSAITNSVPAGILIIDPETHVILDANKAALRLFGSDGEQVVGRICHHYICPAERGACPITDKGQHIDHSERILLNALGERIPILKSVERVNLGGTDYLFEMFIDISRQKQAEEERNRLVERLEKALHEVKKLSGLLPICASCKRIRDDRGYWSEIELYIQEHSSAQFTHGICPECMKKLYPEAV